MKSIAAEVIAEAIDILGTDAVTENEIETKVASIASDPMEARRLIDWIPEAFGVVLVSHLGKPVLPQTFSAKDNHGKWVSFPFACEPIFAIALVAAQTMFHNGPRSRFKNIASRSCTIDAANNALNAARPLIKLRSVDQLCSVFLRRYT